MSEQLKQKYEEVMNNKIANEITTMILEIDSDSKINPEEGYPMKTMLEIVKERSRQLKNYEPNHWTVILGDDFSQSCKDILEDNLEDDIDNYRKKLIQVAGGVLAAIESLDFIRKLKS
ncbi:MAG: hypothetical protein GY714_09695 [Desulfobacterales bacterium]|nr:hypothetical protein [Desulfobacterales bacterium]